MQPRIPRKFGLALSFVLVAGSIALLIEPGLAPAFRPDGAAHGPILFGNTSPTGVRLYAAAFLLLGPGIGLSTTRRRQT